jgi:hypothetical protein
MDKNTSWGLMVLVDDQNLITFAVMTSGTNLRLSLHAGSDGVTATVFQEVNFNEYRSPM